MVALALAQSLAGLIGGGHPFLYLSLFGTLSAYFIYLVSA